MAKKTVARPVAHVKASAKGDSLFGSAQKVDPALASLFAGSTTPQYAGLLTRRSNAHLLASKTTKILGSSDSANDKVELMSGTEADSDDEEDEHGEEEDNDEEDVAEDDMDGDSEEDKSSFTSTEDSEQFRPDSPAGEDANNHDAASGDQSLAQVEELVPEDAANKGRRKRKRGDDDLESRYMERLAREEARDEARREQERHLKRQKPSSDLNAAEEPEADQIARNEDTNMEDREAEEVEAYEIPQHESLTNSQAPELEKAERTVFLGNVSSDTVTSKSAKKELIQHMSSFLDALPPGDKPHKIDSMRFRSTAYTNMLPKKASYVTQDLMESTTKSTNAYVVYTTKTAARAALRLNGSVVLKRHLRVDSVAHPSKTEPRKCVFVGNLGFVDDESAVQAADDEESKKKRKSRRKQPSDIEEGLWREFGKCGPVENVRVVRDSKTRVGKGFAYVQFMDENAVEAALLYDGKKFPPMLPRTLRVSRAKGIKRSAAKDDTRSGAGAGAGANRVYNPKFSAQQKSSMGRASKLLGRAGAALMNRADQRAPSATKAGAFKTPDAFVFEGHRATAGSHANAKNRGSSKKKGKPNNRSTRRAKAWQTGGGE